VLDTEPIAPSKIQKLLRQDLEIVCLKCLEKEPSRRFASAAELADRLSRIQQGLPIPERGPALVERLVRSAMRHPAQSLAMMSLGALVVVMAAAIFSYVRQARAVARQQLQSRQTAVDDLVKTGAARQERGDNHGALESFVEALELEPFPAAREEMHRRRIGETCAQTPRLLEVWGADTEVYCIDVSPDGRRLLAGDKAGRVQVFELATGSLAYPSLEHPAEIKQAVFSPDGRYIIVWEAGVRLVFWDAESGQIIPDFFGKELVTDQLSVNRDPGHPVLLTRKDNAVQLWDLALRQPVGLPLVHGKIDQNGQPNREGLQLATVSYDGRTVVTPSIDRTARVWRFPPSAEREISPLILRGHHHQVWFAAVSRDGNWIATGGMDAVPRLWRGASGKLAAELKNYHESTIRNLVFSPDDRFLATCSTEGRIAIWDVETQKLVFKFDHQSECHAVLFSSDNAQLVTAGNVLKIWDLGRRNITPLTLQHDQSVSAAAFEFSGRRLFTAGKDGTVRLWDLASDKQPIALRHEFKVSKFVYSPATVPCRLATGCWGLKVFIWDPATGRLLTGLEHPAQAKPIGFSHAGDYLVTLADDSRIRVWHVNAAEHRQPLMVSRDVSDRNTVAIHPARNLLAYAAQTASVEVVSFPDGNVIRRIDHPHQVTRIEFVPAVSDPLVLTTCHDGVTRIWDAFNDRGRVIAKIENTATLGPIAFSPDGTHVAIPGSDGRIRISETMTGKQLTALISSSFAPISSLDYSPDGRRLAVGAHDGSVEVRDLANTTTVKTSSRHSGIVSRVAFSADGRLLLTASYDRIARIWDAGTGEPVTPRIEHPNELIDACFSPDGRSYASAAKDELVRIFPLHRDDRPVDELVRWSELFNGSRRQSDGSNKPLIGRQLEALWQDLRRARSGI
jgi:WD40 repeat protein